MPASPISNHPDARDGFIPAGNGALYYRETGQGAPLVVLHGGPDFDHRYLLPDMDRLSDEFRLVYYDQRGRGRSARGVHPADVSIESEIADIERVRQSFGWESIALLGHSWGGVLAMEYAARHPRRLSHLVLLNTAPASHDDYLHFRQDRIVRAAGDIDRLQEIASTAAYQAGDPDAVAAYYRVHFRATVKPVERLAVFVERLTSGFTAEGVLKARSIETRLMEQTLLVPAYDLLPTLSRLSVPALVVHGTGDFIPVQAAERVARAIPGARFVLLDECGHFSYMDRPGNVRDEIVALLRAAV